VCRDEERDHCPVRHDDAGLTRALRGHGDDRAVESACGGRGGLMAEYQRVRLREESRDGGVEYVGSEEGGIAPVVLVEIRRRS